MMKNKNAVNWFEIPVNDYERAIGFYEYVLNTRLKRDTMDGIDFAAFPCEEQGVSGSLTKADFLTPGTQGSVVYLSAEGILDQALDRAIQKGAQVVFPKTHIGECGFIAHLIDSEGNKVALHSFSA